MQFSIEGTIEILARTPQVLDVLLRNISDDWAMNNEGPDTFSPYDVVGHLVHGERTDWVARMEVILSDGENKTFTPYDRFAQYEESKGKTLNQLLDEFKTIRAENIEILRSKNINEKDFTRTGIHPSFGEVQLSQLISTWAVHDLTHIAQITRVMGKQYKSEMGPWPEYFRILSF